MYNLVAVELDGTMLNSYGMVTDNTKNVIINIGSTPIVFLFVYILCFALHNIF